MTVQEPYAHSQQKLPDDGRFHFDDWVAICNCSDDSVTKTIKDYSIPVLSIPGQRVIDAAIWWRCIYAAHPELLGEPTAQTKRKPRDRRVTGK